MIRHPESSGKTALRASSAEATDPWGGGSAGWGGDRTACSAQDDTGFFRHDDIGCSAGDDMGLLRLWHLCGSRSAL